MDANAEALNSKRITGASLRSLGRKRMLLQRDPMRVEWVELLEHITLGDVPCSFEDRLIAGHALWLLYARSRHWDSQFIIQEPSIEGRYVEASTSRTKTSNRRGRRNKAIVLVGVCKGLLSRPWAEAWLELRKEVLLCATDDQPLLPGIASDGSWSGAAVESGAFGMHLRDLLLRHGVPASMLWNIGSHSLKATVLSWVAKAGVLKEHRRVLGYHEDPGDRSVFGYSRDIFAVPLREMEKVIEAIGEGRFLPDESRSGYWKKESEEPNAELVLVPELEDQVDDKECSPCDGVSTPRLPSIGPPSVRDREDSPQDLDGWEIVDTVEEAAESEPTSPESDDSSSLQSSSSSDEVAEVDDSEKEGDQVSDADDLPKRGVERSPASSSNGTVWVNANTMRLHFGRTGDVNLLACGRPRGPQHIEIALHLAFVPGDDEHSKCKTCFGQITDAPLSLGNPRSASVCAVLGDEEMLTSFFEVLEPDV
jgi:hypothetical protein